ncbi:MAG: class I adenylate-forming enzyme family protein [Niveispirillum sp.]|uniref:class I adenylate-forming enzyme family protein n=1 Tax=Niveispirillum sp. TaxID=1917217 RepID=UPI0040375525
MRPFLTLHDPATARAHYNSGLWMRDTFYMLLADAAWTKPDHPALRDGQETLTWRDVHLRADAMADDLVRHGLGVGDRVSMWLSNKVDAVITFLACSREGIACNPSLHRTYTCREIADLLTTLGSAALLTEDGWGADRATCDFDAMMAQLPFLKRVYTPSTMPGAGGESRRPVHDNPDTVAYLAFTSGTTGTPKCVMHSANTLLANGRDLVRDWGLDDRDVILTLSPLSHHIAWVAVCQWLFAGCLLVTDDAPAGMGRLDWTLTTGATYVLGVPTHAMDILQEQKARDLATLGSVRTFYMAGAPIPAVVAEDFMAQGITPQNVYGMTENSSHQYTHPGDSPDIWTRTCGRGGRGYEIRIFDPEDADRPLGPGQTGQIGGRGATLMLGYFGNQRATESSFNRDGWFLSGDLGSLDDEGNLRIEGRLKDLIIRGGHNIYPSRIESLALTHDAIRKAAVFAVADERLGERVCLAVVGEVTSDEALHHLAREGLSKFDMPEWFLKLEAFPLTPSGKILKRDLVDRVARGDLKPVPVRYIPPKVAVP